MPERARAPALRSRPSAQQTAASVGHLKGKALSLDHPAYEHLRKCSPCYVEFRSLQESMSAPDSRSSSSGHLLPSDKTTCFNCLQRCAGLDLISS